MLNPVWLITYKTLVETGHFTKTAEKLFMTQPGVSQHIKKLETELNVSLLTKIGKRFELTEAGREVYLYACRQEKTEANLKEKIQNDSPYSGECRFAMSGSLSMQLYPLLLKRQLEHPQLTISLEAAPNSRIAQLLLDNHIQLGLMTQQLPSADLDYKVIGNEELCLIVSNQHQDKPFSPGLLSQIGLIDHPDCSHYLSKILTQTGFAKSIETIATKGYVNQLNQILVPVSHNIGFTVLPVSAYLASPEKDKLATIPLPEAVNETVYLVSKKHQIAAKRYDWFIGAIKQQFIS